MKKASILNNCCRSIRVALFHSTPIMERKKSHCWDSFRSSNSSYSNKQKKMHAKMEKLRNINEDLFKDKDYSQEDGSFSSKDSSWFRKDYSKGPRRNRASNEGPRYWGKRGSSFCVSDDEGEIEVETIFRSAFGRKGSFFWPFVNEDYSQPGRSSTHSFNQGKSWRQKFEFSEDDDPSTDDSSTNSEFSHSNLASHRMVLGLSANGPLKLEDVKSAYRYCAMKWHPDRHQGSSKVMAEEKFKHCSAAYQSLCDKLDVN